MRKFALIPLFACMTLAQMANAQVRDLFAEFEQENTVQEAKSSAVATSSAAAISSSAVATSSAAAISSSAVATSSAAASSSSIVVMSSVAMSSSSVVESSSSALLESDSAKVDSTLAKTDSSLAAADTAKVDSSVAQDSVAKDSAMSAEQSYVATMNAIVDSAKAADSLAALSSSSSSELNLSSSSMSRRDLLGPVKVSKVHGIDEMKGSYKSPRKALFMSLVIPGSGQLYVGGTTFNKVRGGVYLALEAALWGSWYYFTIHKYDDQVRKYKSFAKKHYSIGRYEFAMREIYHQLADETEETNFESRYMSSRESFCKALYGTAESKGCYTKGNLFYNDKNHENVFLGKKKLGDEIKGLKDVYDMSSIYQEISLKTYVLGWDDVTDAAVVSNLNLSDSKAETVLLGNSKNMDKYRSMRSKANDYADMQAWFFGGIILNHVISAVDAALSASFHNSALYSEDVSWYDHLHFDSYVNVIEGLDVGVRANWGF